MSLNIGPVGWRNSKPDILEALEGLPAMLALQDTRLPKRYFNSVRASMKKAAPQYQLFFDSKQERLREASGQRRKYWMG
eukprot:659694-Rhodomonas_salina.1